MKSKKGKRGDSMVSTKYNLISIESRIKQLTSNRLNNITNLGEKYVQYASDNAHAVKTEREVLSELYTYKATEHLVNFLHDCIPNKSIKLSGMFLCDDVTITYSYYQKYNMPTRKTAYFAAGINKYLDNFIIIETIVSVKGSGAGSKALSSFLKEFNGIPIVVQAGFLFLGDYEFYKENNDRTPIDNLVSFYQKAGFIDINEEIGSYQDSVILINLNGAAQSDVGGLLTSMPKLQKSENVSMNSMQLF